MSLPILRPIRMDDLPTLVSFAHDAAYGISSLPRMPNVLENKILTSEQSFKEKSKTNKHQAYLFCLELDGKVIGTTGITAKIGIEQAFYAYHLVQETIQSSYLGISREMTLLKYIQAQKHPTEIGTLFLSPEARGKAFGKLLSFSRFLFMSEFPDHFSDRVIAEMRGVNIEGYSPFWEAVGRHFYKMDFPNADLLRSECPQCIEDLFPKHPLYYDLLPKEAQEVIGKTHPETQGAYKMLLSQGFNRSHYVDLYDGGPHLHASIANIDAVKNSKVAKIKEIRPIHSPALSILTNNRMDFRATLAFIITQPDGIVCPEEVTDALNVTTGDEIRYYTLT